MAYYQRGVHPSDYWKLAIVTHRGHEMWRVAPMGLANSVAHMQKFMDKLFKAYMWKSVAVYIDDILVFSATFEDHLRDLDEVLTILENAGLTLKPEKYLVGYHSIKLLGKVVDKYGLTTTAERVEGLTKQRWPTTLRDLETFIGQCGYMCQDIPYYAQIIAPLQALKTKLFRTITGISSLKKTIRKAAAEKVKVPAPTPKQRKAFNLIKTTISKWIRHHLDWTRPVIIYVDASRAWGYGIAVYQLSEEFGDEVPKDIDRSKLRPTMFISRELKSAETHYWPTELEAGGLVWACQKLRHIVQTCQTVVYTDHRASEAIAKMRGLQTTSPGKKNLRLANWSLFLSQFWHNMEVRYCQGIHNVMADALSRLRHEVNELSSEEKEAAELRQVREAAEENDIHSFNTNEVVSTTLVELTDDFKQRLTDAYGADPHFAPIAKVLKEHLEKNDIDDNEDIVGRSRSAYRISKSSGLLYYEDQMDNRLRLCIPRKLLKEVLQLAHDSEAHYGINKTYGRLLSSFFAPSLLRKVRQYISHCPKCMINKTLRDKPHGQLQPIPVTPEPFHTIAMDFITGLPPATCFGHGEEQFDSILTCTDKYAKTVKLMMGKSTYTAVDWAEVFWRQVYPDWGLPAAIISDRDPKFLSLFWKGLFQKAGTKFLLSTSYHPQTDGQSEKTNQTIEIALRHYISYSQNDWPMHLPSIQASVNTATSASTKHSLFEILYGANPRHALNLLLSKAPSPADDWAARREMIRKDATDSIVHAQAEMVKYTDPKRKAVAFKVGDKVFLRLSKSRSHGYTLPSAIKPKLSQQRAGPFEITELVGRNAYRLRLPPTWRIHDVISVVYLDPAPNTEDPYGRTAPPPPPVVKNADDVDAEWEVEAIVKKRVSRGTRNKPEKIEYLVRWKGFGSEYDDWIEEGNLESCARLVREYEHSVGNVEWAPPVVWAEALRNEDITEAEDRNDVGNENGNEMETESVAEEIDNGVGEFQFQVEPATIQIIPAITTSPSPSSPSTSTSPIYTSTVPEAAPKQPTATLRTNTADRTIPISTPTRQFTSNAVASPSLTNRALTSSAITPVESPPSDVTPHSYSLAFIRHSKPSLTLQYRHASTESSAKLHDLPTTGTNRPPLVARRTTTAKTRQDPKGDYDHRKVTQRNDRRPEEYEGRCELSVSRREPVASAVTRND